AGVDARREADERELLVERPSDGLQLFVGDEVPLVDRDDDGLTPIEREVRQPQLVITKLERVDDEDADVAAAQRGLGTEPRVVLDVAVILAPDPGGIDEYERAPGERELDVNRVARGTGFVGDDDAFVAHDGVEQA